jgi:hypothetical protein
MTVLARTSRNLAVSQLRTGVVRSEKLVSEAGDTSGKPEEGERTPLEAATKQRATASED